MRFVESLVRVCRHLRMAAHGMPFLLVPAVLAGQGCPATPPIIDRGRDRWLLGAETLVELQSGRLAIGQAMLTVDRSEVVPKVDTSFGAFLLREGAPPLRIARPNGMPVKHPRALRTGPDEAFVTFAGPLYSADGSIIGDSSGVWSTRLRHGAFTQPRLAARIGPGTQLEPENSGNLVLVKDEIVMPLTTERSSTDGRMDVALLRFRGDSVTVDRVPLAAPGVGTVDFAVHEGRWYVAAVATSRDVDGEAGLLLAERTESGWQPARWIVPPGGDVGIAEPRLLSTSEGLVLAWTAVGDVGLRIATLTWRGVAGAPDSTRRTMTVSWPVMRGTAPFQHLLSFAIDSSRGQVVQLLPSGMIEVATFENMGVRAPVVGGSPEWPVALGLIANDQETAPVQVALFDLRCGLGATRPPR